MFRARADGESSSQSFINLLLGKPSTGLHMGYCQDRLFPSKWQIEFSGTIHFAGKASPNDCAMATLNRARSRYVKGLPQNLLGPPAGDRGFGNDPIGPVVDRQNRG